ncbi:hypothetical protein HY967_03085 [Candidatus Jorgensenbacteria bacterium]|nr:hypothetical protein [Candidatus Jorgensenbacteria bacterium]
MARYVSDQSPILKSKLRAGQRRLYLRFIIIFCIVVVIGALVYFVFYTDTFKIKKLEVIGSRRIASDAVVDAVVNTMQEVSWRRWFDRDHILFWLLGEKPKGSLGKLPIVEDISIKIDAWERTIRMDVRERDLFGIWCTVQDCYGFDRNGVVFASAPVSIGSLLLKVEDENDRLIVSGYSVLPDRRWIQNIITTLPALIANQFNIVKIKIKELNLREWVITVDDGLDLYFSLDFVPESLNDILENLRDRLRLDGLTYIDFRVPNRIYYK